MASQPAEFSISNVFNNTFGVIARNAAIFLGLSLVIVGLPQLGIGMYVTPAASDPTALFTSAGAVVTSIVGYFVFLFRTSDKQYRDVIAERFDGPPRP